MNYQSENSPVVSIIIATYNRAGLLPETLDSILEQHYKNWECIIVDDASTDNTADVVNKYIEKDSRFKFFRRSEQYKSGPAGAFNYGLDLSKGDLIQWFGSDDIMYPEMLSEKAKIFIENPNVQSVFSNLSFFEKRDEITGQTKLRIRFSKFYENALTWNVPDWSLNFMFRSRFLKSINIRFDESLKRLIDYDFHSRIFIKYPHNVFLLDKVLCSARRNNDSITTDYFRKDRLVDLQKSEYIVVEKIVKLLIAENKFTNNIEKSFYKDHKRRITNLIRASDREVVDLFKDLVEVYLGYNKKHFKLFRFRLGLSMIKIIPLNNFFLIYKNPKYVTLVHKFFKRIYKSIFNRGYLKEKLKQKVL